MNKYPSVLKLFLLTSSVFFFFFLLSALDRPIGKGLLCFQYVRDRMSLDSFTHVCHFFFFFLISMDDDKSE